MTSPDTPAPPSGPADPIGLIGLGTMGRNLALNLADHGTPLVVWERDPQLAALARDQLPAGTVWADSPAALAAILPAPRAILLMVTAGAAVDAVVEALQPSLAPGDVVLDGGNADARDTARRQAGLAGTGIELIGLGVSGGEEGARFGPALMAGGSAVCLGAGGPCPGRHRRPLARRHAVLRAARNRRRRTLRQDGAQRHRVRRDAGAGRSL